MHSSAIVRPATLSDVDQLYALDTKCFTAELTLPAHFKRFIKYSSAAVLVGEDNGEIIASAIVLFRKCSKIARLYSIAVDANYRSTGIASKLYLRAEKIALERGCDQLRLEVYPENDRAINFYFKHGYQVFGVWKEFFDDGTDALRMIKYLNTVNLKSKNTAAEAHTP